MHAMVFMTRATFQAGSKLETAKTIRRGTEPGVSMIPYMTTSDVGSVGHFC